MESSRRAWDSAHWGPARGDWFLPHPLLPDVAERVGAERMMRQDPAYRPFSSMAFPDGGYGYRGSSEYPRKRHYRECCGCPTRREWRARRPRGAPGYYTIPLAVRGIPETEDTDWFYGPGGELHYL